MCGTLCRGVTVSVVSDDKRHCSGLQVTICWTKVDIILLTPSGDGHHRMPVIGGVLVKLDFDVYRTAVLCHRVEMVAGAAA